MDYAVAQNHEYNLGRARQRPGSVDNDDSHAENEKRNKFDAARTSRVALSYAAALNHEYNLDRARRESDNDSEIENKERSESDVARISRIAAEVESGHEMQAALGAAKYAFKLRHDANEHLKAPWIKMFGVAILGEILSGTWIGKIICSIPLFIFLWGRGKWKVRIARRIFLFLGCIPIIGLIPLNFLALAWAWHSSNKEYKKNMAKLKEVEKEQEKSK